MWQNSADDLGDRFWHKLHLNMVRNGEFYRKITIFNRDVDLESDAGGAHGGDNSMCHATSIARPSGKRRWLA